MTRYHGDGFVCVSYIIIYSLIVYYEKDQEENDCVTSVIEGLAKLGLVISVRKGI